MRLRRLWSGLLLAAGVAACAPSPVAPLPPPEPVPPPDPSQVERVLFLLGDPGEARMETYPVLARLQRDIEQWAGGLQADSAVALLILGDLIYPEGLHPRGTPEFPGDSAILMDQVRLVAGPEAIRRGVKAYFLAGNHDWGLEEDWEGFVALKRIDEFLAMARTTTGADVELAPEAGSGGPFVVDWGPARLVLLDTAWWLQHADEGAQVGLLESIDSTMAGAGDREVIFAAHHPFISAGEHGGSRSFWELFGFEYLLSRSGAILQDLSSIPYRRLQRELREIFAEHGPPLAFIGGHEHTLQVIDAVAPTDPRYSLVSGSGSKLSAVGRVAGLRFGRGLPGYMRLVFERGGGVSVFVEAVPAEYQSCPAQEPRRTECMAAGVAAFETVYSQRLR